MTFEPQANLEQSYHGFHSSGTQLTMTKYLMVAYEQYVTSKCNNIHLVTYF